MLMHDAERISGHYVLVMLQAAVTLMTAVTPKLPQLKPSTAGQRLGRVQV